jgi:hypothetical protein
MRRLLLDIVGTTRIHQAKWAPLMRLAHSPVNLAIFIVSAAVFMFAKWRPAEAAALASWLTTGTNIIVRIIHNWPDWSREQHDLMPVVLGTCPLVLGVHFLELLGQERQDRVE